MEIRKTIFSKIVLSILAVLIMLSLGACGNANVANETLSGKFVMSTMKTDGETLDFQTLEGIFDDIPNNFYVEFKNEDDISFSFDGEGGYGTYQREGNTVKIIMEGDNETMQINGTTLTWDLDDTVITFEKQ